MSNVDGSVIMFRDREQGFCLILPEFTKKSTGQLMLLVQNLTFDARESSQLSHLWITRRRASLPLMYTGAEIPKTLSSMPPAVPENEESLPLK
ncbi:hypothetical protein VTL71DRAFT_10763 [Oculimacula yallundae]|uniref:Uncharacterized protein n=1 Tax=Oculimacula yallundae TaxID=86028 RepID=A0ABR4CU70_9HELO